MLTQAWIFVEAIKAGLPPRWLTFSGKTGTGKTHLARGLWAGLTHRFDWTAMEFIHRPIYWPEFVGDLRDGNAYAELKDLCRWPLLVLDDIGAERDTSGFATEQLNMLLGRRAEKWTIITTNLLLDDLAKVDPRIADRIMRPPNMHLELTCPSYSHRQNL